MQIRERLAEILGTSHPLIQAPMAAISTAPLAAAVSAAGALGSLGTAVAAPAAVTAMVEEARRLTDRPVAVNFFVHAPPRADEEAAERMWRRLEPYRREQGLEGLPRPPLVGPPPFGPDMLERVLALAPRVVSFHFGLPDDEAVRALQGAGIRILSTATTVAEARLLESRGVDAVIAQGLEAGGHRGSFDAESDEAQLGTMALVPQVVDAVRVPVIAAGGIFDGRGIAAAMALGAAGVQLGTAFLGCPEAVLDPVYRRTLLSPRAARTRITRLLSGRPARAIVTRLLRDLAREEDLAIDFPLQRVLCAPLHGDVETRAMWAGQAARGTRELPAAELVAALLREAAQY